MQTHYRNQILVLILGAVFVLFVSSAYIKSEQAKYLSITEEKLSAKEKDLATLLQAIQSETPHEIDQVITDCSLENRVAFDRDLGRLSVIQQRELPELQMLFNACGDYYAVRKAVLVSHLEREFNAYKDLVEIFSQADTKSEKTAYDTAKWESAIATEIKKSELSLRLVAIQGEIIALLKDGVQITSDEMQLLLVEGQRIREALTSTPEKVDAIHTELQSL